MAYIHYTESISLPLCSAAFGLIKALQKGKISSDLSLAVPVGNILLCTGFSSSKNLQFVRAFPMCCKNGSIYDRVKRAGESLLSFH